MSDDWMPRKQWLKPILQYVFFIPWLLLFFHLDKFPDFQALFRILGGLAWVFGGAWLFTRWLERWFK